MTRARLALLLVCLAAVVASCGGSEGGSSASLDDSLGYLPKNAPVVVTIDTDLDGAQWKNLDKALARFPFGGTVKAQIKSSLTQQGVDFDKDVKPLLGNEVVVGSASAQAVMAGSDDESFVAVFPSGDGAKLRELLEKQNNTRKSGKLDGSDLYESGDGSAAVLKGDTAIVANDRPTLDAALQRAKGDDKLTQAEFDAAFADLPSDPLVRVYGDAQQLVNADPEAAAARNVKWVAGLRKFGVTVSAEGDGLALDGRLNTEGVAPQDLPIAAGDAAPALARLGDYALGQRDLAQSLRFAQSTAQTVDPEGYEKFEARKGALESKLGIDLNKDVIDQFGGDTTVAGGFDGTFALRSQVKDPDAMRATLAKFVKAGKAGDLEFAAGPGELIEVTDEDGEKAYIGMVGDTFVAAQDPARAMALAAAEPKPVGGVKGALVFVANGQAIARRILDESGQGGIAGQFLTGSVGDLTAYLTAAPNAIRGRAKLVLK